MVNGSCRAPSTKRRVCNAIRPSPWYGSIPSKLSGSTPPHPVLGCRAAAPVGVRHQQFRRWRPSPSYRALARGAVLQVDQTASADQGVLRHVGERGEDEVWTAVCTYLLVAIVRKRLNLDASLHTILQILSVSIFEKTPMDAALFATKTLHGDGDPDKQLSLLFNRTLLATGNWQLETD